MNTVQVNPSTRQEDRVIGYQLEGSSERWCLRCWAKDTKSWAAVEHPAVTVIAITLKDAADADEIVLMCDGCGQPLTAIHEAPTSTFAELTFLAATLRSVLERAQCIEGVTKVDSSLAFDLTYHADKLDGMATLLESERPL